MSKPKKPLTVVEGESVVQPSLKFEDDKKHVLQQLLESESAPVLRSVGYAQLPSLKTSASSWVSYMITSQGEKVLKIEVEEPNTRAIAEESAKIAFVNLFMGMRE